MTTFFLHFPVHLEACVNRPRLLLSVGLGNRGPPNKVLSMAIRQLRVLPLGQADSVECRGPPMSDYVLTSCRSQQPKVETRSYPNYFAIRKDHEIDPNSNPRP